MPKQAIKKIKTIANIKIESPKMDRQKMNQVLKGRVVSAGKTLKTVVVLIEGTKTHPLYKKTSKSSKRFLVHDEMGVKEGDLVEVIKIRPISKHKHWQVIKVVGRDLEAMVTEELKSVSAEAIAEVMPEEVAATPEKVKKEKN